MIKRIFGWLFGLLSLSGLIVACMCADVQLRYLGNLRTVTDQDARATTAIVLGASVNQDGSPSDALRDRLVTGAKLYKNGHVRNILVTGDDGGYHAAEVETMKTFMLQQGIPDADIMVDPHGYRTYESCKRASNVYQVKDAVVVTQRFHIARAVYLCEAFGIRTTGVTSDLNTYKKIVYFWSRDLAASVKAWVDIHVITPEVPTKEKA